jgi:hypothetical protein
MTLEKARQLIAERAQFEGGYSRNGVRLVLGEVHREHGQGVVDQLIREFDLQSRFGIDPGTDLSRLGY